MRRVLFMLMAVVVAASAFVFTSRADNVSLRGDYVEVRTASVFAGACHFNGEVVTTGREAMMAWNVTSGKWQGIDLTGVRVLAIVSSDANLAEANAARQSEIVIDSRASRAQSLAMPHDKSYDAFFTAGWKTMYFVFDEDDDDHRWERVEMYYPMHGFGGPKDIDIYSTKRWRRGNYAEQNMVNEGEKPGLDGHPQSDSLGDRGEFDEDNSGNGKLYVGVFDRKLHLAGAEWGACGQGSGGGGSIIPGFGLRPLVLGVHDGAGKGQRPKSKGQVFYKEA